MYHAYAEDKLFKDVGRERQLFFSDDIISWVYQITRTYHSPAKRPENPLISRDQPWEVNPYFRGNSFNVVRDPADGLFHCWYEDYFNFFNAGFRDGGVDDRIYYARSEDGLHWEKPLTGKYEIDGRDTNTVYSYPPHVGGNASDAAIIIDPIETDSARKFKMIYFNRFNHMRKQRTGYGTCGLNLAFSPNGIDWTPFEGNPVIPDWADDMQQVYFDPIDKKFICYGRGGGRLATGYRRNCWQGPVAPGRPEGLWGTRRRIHRVESEDLIHWSEPVMMFDPGPEDNLDDEFYGFIPWRVGPNLHLGILTLFHYVHNVVDNRLLYSWDGWDWNRRLMHRPFIPRGPEGSYDCYDAETGLPPIEVGDELWFYYGGGRVHHDWWVWGQHEGLDVPEAYDPEMAANGYHLCLAAMRRDGYVSLDATVREGMIETKPLWSEGTQLFINARCEKDGYVDVELVTNWDHEMPGCKRSDCIRFTGDSVSHPVRWNNAPNLANIHKFFKIRFHLRNAQLYGFHFGDPAA